jgi:hypothetical protein
VQFPVGIVAKKKIAEFRRGAMLSKDESREIAVATADSRQFPDKVSVSRPSRSQHLFDEKPVTT